MTTRKNGVSTAGKARNGSSSNGVAHAADEDGLEELNATELSRPSPDAILADEADPDTLLGLESDSDAGSSRPVSMLPSAKRASKRVSRQLLDVPLGDDDKGKNDETPTQTTFVTSPDKDSTTDANIPVTLSEEDLRSQIIELTTQVTSLNNKLVTSFMRIGDLEDDVSQMQEASTTYRNQIATLEKEREEHLAALNTGLLVEKEHVSTEMQKMMERLVEETAERGKAVSDKQKIEAELDELSSSLFSEANKMVAVERLARARAEEKSKSMEERLKDTEEIVGQQQKRLVELQAAVEKHSADSEERQGNEKEFNEKASSSAKTGLLRRSQSTAQGEGLLLIEHKGQLRLDIVPYVELRAFLNHLRRLRLQLAPFYSYPLTSTEESTHSSTVTSRTSSPAPNQMGLNAYAGPLSPSALNQSATTSSPFTAANVSRHKDFPSLPANVEQLIYLPSQVSTLSFLKRINEEDCEPCLRLDAAPGLNWLSRRQLQTAILEGNLMIEPIFGGGIYDEEQVRLKAAGSAPAACAMCGKAVVNVPLPGGESASDASTWMNAANSLQASVNAMTSSLPGRESTASPPPPTVESTKSKTSIFSTLRNISGGSSRTASANTTTVADGINSIVPSQTNLQSVGVVEDQFAPRPPAIPTHIFRISESSASRYLLCPNYCLRRLRAACDFWGYIRSLERAVVLEGKFAWDEEVASASITEEANTSTSTKTDVEAPRLPTKDSALSKGQLSSQDGDDDEKAADERSESQSEEEVTKEEDGGVSNEQNGERKADPAGDRSRKVSLTQTASDADENDFADAMSQHSDEEEKEGDNVKEEKEDDNVEESTKEESVKETELAPAAEITSTDTVLEKQEGEKEEVEEEEGNTVERTPVARPPPLPKTARPVPVHPTLSATPPALPPRRVVSPPLPPRRVLSPSTPSGRRMAPSLPPSTPVDLGPEPKRVLPLHSGVEKTAWEEKVWLEVNRLRADMWSARVGVEGSSGAQEA